VAGEFAAAAANVDGIAAENFSSAVVRFCQRGIQPTVESALKFGGQE